MGLDGVIVRDKTSSILGKVTVLFLPFLSRLRLLILLFINYFFICEVFRCMGWRFVGRRMRTYRLWGTVQCIDALSQYWYTAKKHWQYTCTDSIYVLRQYPALPVGHFLSCTAAQTPGPTPRNSTLYFDIMVFSF